ncbi:MAG TPA: HtaA domain-containing protein [Solirubrobacterales bacterium]|nr:HtaA domain-containing protein [Solirubrobacterales bacterium]
MSWNAISRKRLGTAFGVLAAAAATAAALAAPAGAVSGQGAAAIRLAQHDQGRTLSGQGVRVLAQTPATQTGNELTLPISELDLAKPSTNATGSLTFKRGKRTVVFGSLRFDLAAGTLVGTGEDGELALLKLGAAPAVDATAGTATLIGGKLRLTKELAVLLRDELRLKRALVHKGVGMAWLSAKANPTHAPAQALVSSNVNWGFLASWRGYVLFADAPPFGTLTPSEGATPTGSPMSPATTWNFPGIGGGFEKGLYGGSDRLSVNAGGAVTFAKAKHCIMEIKLANPRVVLEGTASSLVVDLTYNVDKPTGPGTCEDLGAPVSAPNTTFATLNPGAVAPSWSADGKTVTWTKVPAALTAAGTAPFGSFYKAGQELEPITITATIG